ncbi:MAG: DNA polymerase III subunit alpha [bacterium]
MSGFVHLHLHTSYSVLDGAIKIPDLSHRLKELDMKACAMTDHGAMFGAVKFYKEMKSKGIKPIIGCEGYMTAGSRFTKKDDNFHLVLLCQDKEGYKNLSKLVTSAYTEGFYYKPRMDRELLEKYNKGLIATSACLKGEISQLLLHGKDDEAKTIAKWYKDVFDGRFYLELQDNGIEEQYLVNEKIIKLSMELDIPIVATNDCHYIKKSDAFIQEVLLCVSTKKTLEDKNRMRMSTDEFYVKTEQEMASGYFKEYPQALTNTLKIVDQCDFSFKTGIHYLPVIGNDEEESKKIIEEDSWKGLDTKTVPEDKKEIYHDRLRYELDVIKKMGYSSYYLIVSDFINWAKKNNVPVGPGRGSGAASLVAYALGITNLDPITYDLIFERFLNPERVSLPDFDIDFCSRRRDQVYEYIVSKYGKDYTTKITTFGFLKAKSAITDVGRVLGLTVKDIKEITSLVPLLDDKETIKDAINKEPELRKLLQEKEQNKQLIDLACAIEGAVRNVGVHAGGVIISSIPIVEIVPLIPAADGIIATQFDMKDIEEVGLVKFDLLAIETLTIMDDALTYIRKFKNIEFDIDNINLYDPKIYEMLSRGDTIGIFQLESTGMQKLLRDLVPDCFEDIIAVNALYRPGPLGGGMVDQFINRKHGREEIEYPFQELESILKETYGIIVYQEQVQRIASTLAGYSLGEADLLRRAMGKKKPAEMAKQKERFIAGAKEKGHDAKDSEDVFDLMAKFAEYGFNKAHAAVYALTAYKTAYMKYYYPAEFLSALLTSKMGKDVDSANLYISDAIAHGIKVLSPDVNESFYDFEPRGENIRFGFGGIKNIGTSAIENIQEERSSGNLFKGFVDFCCRVDTRRVNKKTLENLIKAGAFDSFSINRGILFNNLDKIMNYAIDMKRDAESGQCSLFGNASATCEYDESLIDQAVTKWDKQEQLQHEKEVIGFYISSHPMDLYESILRVSGVPEIHSLQHVPPESNIIAAGIMTLSKEIVTKTGYVMGIFTIEDKTGRIEVVAFKDVYREIQKITGLSATPALCFGKLSNDSGVNKIMVEKVKLLEEKDFTLDIKTRGDKISKDALEEIFNVLPKNSGFIPLNMELVFPNEGAVVLNLGSGNIGDCSTACSKIKELNGKEVTIKWSLEV